MKTRAPFQYDPLTEPLQPVMEEIKSGNMPFKVKCPNKARAIHTSQRLYMIFRWYKEQFKKQNLAPPLFPELKVRQAKQGPNWYVQIENKPNVGIMITKDGQRVEIKSGKQNWDFDNVRVVDV